MKVRNRAFKLFFINYIILGISQSLFGPLIPILSRDFETGLNLIGLSLSINALGLLVAGIFSGNLAELFGKKKVTIIGCILVILSLTGLFLSYHFLFFLISYFIFGLGLGTFQVNISSIVCDLFKEDKSKKLVQLGAAFFTGVLIGPLLVSLVLNLDINWRNLFLLTALLNIPPLILFCLLNIKKQISKTDREAVRNVFNVNREILSNPYFVLCGIIVFLHTGLVFSFQFWFTTYFTGLKIPVKISSLFLSIYLLSNIIGMLSKNVFLKKLDEKKLLFICSILGFIFLLSSTFADSLIFKIIFIFLFGYNIIGLFEMTLSLSVKVKPNYTGSTSTLIFSFAYIAMIIFHYTIGYFSEKLSVESVMYIDLITLFLLIVFVGFLNFYSKFRKNRAIAK